MKDAPPPYRGRFAPSPSGPLHFGSLVAALASCLDARTRGGAWLVRMEDVDEGRCSASAATGILRTLERFGFAWDGEVMVQSRRKERYRDLLDRLRQAGFAFPCACTRRELADGALAADGGAVYPGTCRRGLPPGKVARAWRLAVGDAVVSFDDALQGRVTQHLAEDVGDFVLLRADGCYAYQLAVVADDADQGITHVVRGADLLDSTPRQIFLQSRLGLPTPAHAHLPVAVNPGGEKLSKQTRAESIDDLDPALALMAALRFLGQAPPHDLGDLATIWGWAREHWQLAAVPHCRALPAPLLAPARSGSPDRRSA